MKSFKKPLIALLVTGTLAGQATLAPRQAHAVVAAVTGGSAIPALIVLGAGAVAAGGSVVLANSVDSLGGNYGGNTAAISPMVIPFLAGLLIAVAGVVMLDESGAPTPDFQKITLEEAQAARISPQELRAFNRDTSLERVNAVSETIARGIADRKIRDEREAIEFARSEWSAAHDNGTLTDLVYSAVVKRGALAIRRAQRASRSATESSG